MTGFRDRVDPELLPGLEYSEAHPPPTTVAELAVFRAGTSPAAPSCTRAAFQDYSTDGIPLRVFSPAGTGPHPAIYWIHGGGMIAGSIEGDTSYCADLCARTGAVVVAVDYRLAPEHQFPAPLDDVTAGLRWLFASADALSVDPQRVAVAGSSAGGGLAAALTLRNRDSGGPAIAFQYLMYPMLDSSHTSGSAVEFAEIPTWNAAHSRFAWECYLGGSPASAHAVPALAEDLRSLPPTLIQVGELDLFRDEDISFAARLLQAGVPTELHVYPGAYHGFELNCPDSYVGARSLRDRDRALARALHGFGTADSPATYSSPTHTPMEGSPL
ncbi:alpha/beta hydrolase [Arthrobacter sp. zg-Y1110]|uniref:alpha/beta hydrolase n=1 Tax=Arthrobacter sp. zg-Y1110 TaxID=2886932 RepID=UPI001D153B43|nr:alpha/beta hydrolase [Arthrobacter sp. zg-Y1110]MCC3292166.1 alpha/beta hydrolase [Arthrobacter sp. zg-Y1110]UWX85255.1 alpha/beta hydrolase [Arthrobacter sp. zg-Y1110]